MGLFNGLLNSQDSAANNVSSPSPAIKSDPILDPPIKDDSPAPLGNDSSPVQGPISATPPSQTTPSFHRETTDEALAQQQPSPEQHKDASPAADSPGARTPSQSAPDTKEADEAVGQEEHISSAFPQVPAENEKTVSQAQPNDENEGMSLEEIQNQISIINNFKKNPSVEALVALMYHKQEYMEALKQGTLDQLLENIRKYNPLVKALNGQKN